MSERRDDGPLAPRRTLQGGGDPVLPPASAKLDADQRKAAEAQAAQEVRDEQRRAAQEASRREREARSAQRRETKDSAKQEAARQKAAAAAASGPPAAASAAPAAGRGAARPRSRRARLRLTQIDAWSVMKTAFLLSIALGIVLVVAVAIVWAVLGAAGVWDSINSIVQQSVGNASGPRFDVTDYVGTSRVLGFTMVVAVVDVVLITAIATLGAFLYNLSAALLGGIEVTLAEDS